MPDFSALRLQVGSRDDFIDRCDINDEQFSEQQIYTYMNNGDWEAAAGGAEARLQNCPVDIQMHLYAGIALQQLQEHARAQLHFDWYWGLIGSILESGDGKAPETAYVTISIAEEYLTLSALGMSLQWQSTRGNRDVFYVIDQDGNEKQVYFFPDLHWRRMLRLFPE